MRRAAKPAPAKPRRRTPGRSPQNPITMATFGACWWKRRCNWSSEGGADAVSVREAARRAGVSPGAPFRHFPSRDALMDAVAEEAQRRFRAEIDARAGGRRRPAIRSAASARLGLPICAGRCATPRISRSSPRRRLSIMMAPRQYRATMPS